MADRVGEQFGSYSLTRRLGKGAFAEVYLAKHLYFESLAAIKVLDSLDPEDQQKFQNEASKIANLEHPHIVKVLDFGIQGEIPYLVMAYAPNGTLRQRFPRGKQIPMETLLPYITQVGAALQYIHDLKLIHQDVKPENLLLGAKNEVLLSDFGLATLAESTRSQKTGNPAGTASYMAPEQWDGKPHVASDQYALGIMVYEWLAGERPFQGSANALLAQHLHVTPPPLRQKVPTIHPAIEDAVLRALKKKPHERFSSVQAFVTALEQAGQKKLVVPGPTVTPRRSPKPLNRGSFAVPAPQPEAPDPEKKQEKPAFPPRFGTASPPEARPSGAPSDVANRWRFAGGLNQRPPDDSFGELSDPSDGPYDSDPFAPQHPATPGRLPDSYRPSPVLPARGTRPYFRDELEANAFSVGSNAFFLLSGVGAIVGVNTRSWPWAVGTVGFLCVLGYVLGYRKALSLFAFLAIALASTALVYGLTVFLAPYEYSQVQTSHLWFNATRSLTLRHQITAGACIGAICSLWGFFVYGEDESFGLNFSLGIFYALLSGAILWPIVTTLGSIFNWGFGFGFGWEFNLLGGMVVTVIGGVGLISSTYIWKKALFS